jgi:hypothetical protein
MPTLRGVESIRNRLQALCQFLGSTLVSWSSRKLSSVAQSTTEAEYVVAASCYSQLLWITYTRSDFGEECSHVPLMCDNTSAISVAKDPVLHSRTKHIDLRYHFLRNNVEKGNIDLIHVPREKQLVDILTKPLDQATFARLRGELGVVFLFELQLGGLMYICMLHFHLCIISCLHLCIIDCICNICHRDVLLSYALITMIC